MSQDGRERPAGETSSPEASAVKPLWNSAKRAEVAAALAPRLGLDVRALLGVMAKAEDELLDLFAHVERCPACTWQLFCPIGNTLLETSVSALMTSLL